MGARVRLVAVALAVAGPLMAQAPLAVPAGGHPALAAEACAIPRPVAHSRAPGSAKSVALTFDDGPGPSTAAMLRILESARVRASFFNLGVEMAARAAVLRRELRDGDVLGNHTWSHADLPTLSLRAQQRQLDRVSALQRRLTGTLPCVFRPPYRDFVAATLRLAASRHEATWVWSIDTDDWKAGCSRSRWWVNHIDARAEAGASQRHPVILMHDMAGCGSPATALALPRVIAFYKSRGYRFVVVNDPRR